MRLFLAAFLIVISPFCAHAQAEKIVPKTKADTLFSYAPVVKKVAPTVVNIYTKSRVKVMQNTSPFMNDPFFNQFFGGGGLTFGGRPREQVISSLGSGVIINTDGLIVTSHHVVKDAQEITVVLSDKREFEASVVLKDAQTDLAFIKINAPATLPFLPLRDSDTLEVGDLVMAVGNPFGVGQTVTSGIVSGLARKATGVSDYQFFIQTDAAINPGNSGGALVDMNGDLVGINTAIYSKSGGSVGIGFAIPANMVRSLAAAKVQGGKVVHPWIGLSVQTLTPEMAESIGMKTPQGVPQGVIVKKIVTGSPAEKAGVKVGDVLSAFGDTKLTSEHDLQYRLVLSSIGESAKLQVLRGEETKTIAVELIAPPEIPGRDLRVISGHNPLSGLSVGNLSPALAMEIGFDDSASGVVVLGVGGSELGLNMGLTPGDIVLEINGIKITSTQQLQTMIKTSAKKWQIVFKRGANIQTLTVSM
jgi:Do/DeqQ family serine protease